MNAWYHVTENAVRTVPRHLRCPLARLQLGCRVVVRFWLLLSLWHAPLPWLHTHEFAGSHSESLSRHVHKLHGDNEVEDDSHVGWHVHLVLPWRGDSGESCLPDEPPDESGHMGYGLKYGVAGSATPTVLGSGEWQVCSIFAVPAVADSVPSLTVPSLIGHDYQRHRGKHFFETYGGTVSIADLVGVHLC